MENVQWKVEGMTCSNCALTIQKYLEKEGLKNVKVNAIGGDVSFEMNGEIAEQKLVSGIRQLGYQVKDLALQERKSKKFFSTPLHYFLFCLPFTLVLMLHMIPGLHSRPGFHWLVNPWIQLALTIPVYVVGMWYFGRSALKSIRNGMPNMNVLITLGATAAFVYSLSGHIMALQSDYLFYETSATIITLVFLGNYLEDASIRSTQRALNKLARSQKVMANMIAFDDQYHEHIFPVENTQLKIGDLILIKSGEKVPIDCRILWGEADVNESIITGESLPVHKKKKDQLIGGSILENGTVKAQVSAIGNDTVLSNILNLVKQAQGEKPPVQQLADKISAIFVPVVIGIAILTLAVNWIVLEEFTPSLRRSIAVLVIACPCAMGLATPAAIAVGLGRGTRNGILFRNAKSLELFKNIRQVVFDKTGTLTTGKFQISDFSHGSDPDSPDSYRDRDYRDNEDHNLSEDEFKRIAFSIEKYSNHPLAKTISLDWKIKDEIRWKKIEELKGLGMRAEDKEGNIYMAGSFKLAPDIIKDKNHSIYVFKNNELIGWIDLKDEIRPEAGPVIEYLKTRNIKTILLSGDRYEKSKELADKLGITEIIAEQSPEQKLKKVADLNAIAPTAMVGDGINDAPALAKATVGVSMSEASQLAMQSADVVLMDHGLRKFPTALGLGKHTYLTIKQNLFWAFAYNIVAIPVAALGFLTPTFGALVMGLSDVVLAINSVRLFVKRVI